MKIIRFFYSLIVTIKLKLKKHRFEVTPSGDCQIRYIINKYINFTKPDDYIEAYENAICTNEERAFGISIYKKMSLDNDEKVDPARLHFAAAILSLVMILYAIKNDDEYYMLINSENDRKMIKKLVNLVG